MKLIKVHCEKSVMYLNPKYIIWVTTVFLEEYETAVCTGYRADGSMIVHQLDETTEKILEMIDGC